MTCTPSESCPRRWVVERTFGWIMKHRRCVRGCERLPEHHETYPCWSVITVMGRRVARHRKPVATPPGHACSIPRGLRFPNRLLAPYDQECSSSYGGYGKRIRRTAPSSVAARRHAGVGSGDQMSSMPERGAPGHWTGGAQQGSQEWTGTSGQRPTTGPEYFGGRPPGGSRRGGHSAEEPYGSYSGGHPGWEGPVNRDETQVVGRRVVQYIIDYVLAGIIPGLAYWLLDRGSGFLRGFGWALATLIALVVYLWYWVLRPNSHHGQTFAMQLLGVRVISKGGGPASMLQYLVRGVLLVIDTFFFGLVGLITMMASRYHQRVGDHLARTLVVRAGYGTATPADSRDFRRTGSAAADERLARPDMYAEDRYGQGMPPDAGPAGPGGSQRDSR